MGGYPWNRETWIGDFPPDYPPSPYAPQYIPVPQTIFPIGPAPWTPTPQLANANVKCVVPCPWHVKTIENGLEAAVDMFRDLTVGVGIDPESAVATLGDGVLTITVRMRKDISKVHSVPVSPR